MSRDEEHDDDVMSSEQSAFDESSELPDIPRNTKPFRAWGAAHEVRTAGPSAWERFRSSLAGLFGKKPDVRQHGVADFEPSTVSPDFEPSTVSNEFAAEATKPWQSLDDSDAPWGDVYPNEPVASRPLAEEIPNPDDFEAPWDDPYAGTETTGEHDAKGSPRDNGLDAPWGDTPASLTSDATADDVVEPPPFEEFHHESSNTDGSSDPLWDEPRIASAADAPREAISQRDLDLVWSAPQTASDVMSDAMAPSIEQAADTTLPAKRPGFFARFFSRKKKEEQRRSDELEAFVETFNARDTEASAREPESHDFAEAPSEDDFAVAPAVDDFAEAPNEDDFAIAPLVDDYSVAPAMGAFPDSSADPTPSLDHSADDAAQLADFLAATYVPPTSRDIDQAVPPAETERFASAEPESFAPEPEVYSAEPETLLSEFEDDTDRPTDPSVEAEQVTEAAAFADEDSVTSPDVLDALDSSIVEPPDRAEIAPEPKKGGFFSRLLRRGSKAIPVAPTPAIEPAFDSPMDDDPLDPLTDDSRSVDSFPVEQPSAEDESPYVDLGATLSDVPAVDAGVSRWGRPQIPTPITPFAAVDLPGPASGPDDADPVLPFVDARDDFAVAPSPVPVPVPVPQPVIESRVTEAIVQPVFDETSDGETTDEFEVVPPMVGETSDDVAEVGDVAVGAASAGLLGRLFGARTTGSPTADENGASPTPAAESDDLRTDGKPPFVLAKFRMFYNEVIRDKHQKSDVISGFATAIVSAAAADMADPEFAAQLLSKRLSEMLELQTAESNWTGGDAAKYYPDAQYAMVALADETFSTADWPGRSSWPRYALEPKMYGTRGADVEFFRRIDKLLREPNAPRGARDLARVYLLVIASGFRGKFRVPGLKRPLAEYRRRLYEFSHRADPLELYGRDRRIFPAASSKTLASRAVGRHTAAQKWSAAVVVLLIAYAVVSHVAWTKLSADLKDVMSRIETSTAPGGAK